MSTNKLVICPTDPQWTPSAVQMTIILEQIGFIGKPFGSEGSYAAGPNFLKWIEFSGPVIVLPESHAEKRAERLLYEIEFHEPTENIEFLGSALTENPLCPHCNFEFDWSDLINLMYKLHITEIICTFCSHTYPIWNLNWKRTCGFGRFSIDVRHAGQQAVPTQEFLQVLQTVTGQQFGYFYFHL